MFRNFSGSVWGSQLAHQLRDSDGRCVQGEAHQTRGQSHRPCQRASKGKHFQSFSYLTLLVATIKPPPLKQQNIQNAPTIMINHK